MTQVPNTASPPGTEKVVPFPVAYTLIKKTQWCFTCGNQSESSDLFAKFIHRSRFGFGTITHLQAIGCPLYRLPVELICLPTTEVPVCHRCLGPATLSRLPIPPWPTTSQSSPQSHLLVTALFTQPRNPRSRQPSTSSQSSDSKSP